MKDQMTNQEWIEQRSTDCEDCEWYGSKCHCQTEEPDHGIAGFNDDQIRIAELENQIEVLNHFHKNQIADLEARNAGLVEYIDELIERNQNQEMLTTMWKEEANNQRKNAARWQFEYNRAIRR